MASFNQSGTAQIPMYFNQLGMIGGDDGCPRRLMMETSRAVQKAALRSDIKAKLKLLPPEYIHDQSSRVCSKLFNHKSFIQSKAICVYLSMTSEVQTYDIVRKCFEDGKRLFIPKVTGKRSEDMFVLEIESVAQIDSFPRSKWGIPEPPMELVNISTDGTSLGLIDTVIVPGVAFDGSCGRMGHGKGYYGDSYFLRQLI